MIDGRKIVFGVHYANAVILGGTILYISIDLPGGILGKVTYFCTLAYIAFAFSLIPYIDINKDKGKDFTYWDICALPIASTAAGLFLWLFDYVYN